MLIVPQEAGALPTDKSREIVLVYQCPISSCSYPSDPDTAWGRLKSFLQTTLEQNVTPKSSSGLAADLSGAPPIPITSYDLVVWYNDHSFDGQNFDWESSGGPTIVNAIKKAKIPTLVFDGQDFYVTQKLGLIEEGQTGGTQLNQYRMDAAVRETTCGPWGDWGDLWHPLVAKNSACDLLGCNTPNPYVEDQWLTKLYTVDLTDDDVCSYSSPYRYTRPLYSADTDGTLDKITALVDDRRHIVSMGTRSTVLAPPHMSLEYPGEPGNITSNWRYPTRGYYYYLNEVVSYLLTPSPWAPPIGQNTFTETDWTTKSRGFDFQIKRTYSSGAKSIPLEHPGVFTQGNETNWWFNYNQYVVWDKFNDQIILYNETGQAIPMEMVRGLRPQSPGDDEFDLVPRVFTTVNSPNTQIAVFYPADNTDDATLVNPDLIREDPEESDAHACTYKSQAGRNYRVSSISSG